MTTTTTALPHGFTPGSARAALSYRPFRLIWLGMFASSTGTWMQNVALGAYIQARTESAGLVGLMVFAQLGPLLFLSIPGGALASKFPRRPYLITLQLVQLIGSLALAAATAAEGSLTALFLCNMAIGVGNALGNPALQAAIPMLVHRRDMGGAISLSSAQMNGARVVGPLVVGLVGLAGVTEAQIFAANALTYLALIAALAVVDVPDPGNASSPAGWRRLTTGLAVARRQYPVGRILATMFCFSLLCLPFIGLFPSVADVAFGIDPSSSAYKWLYATWALGAMTGALSAATVLARVDKARLVRPAMAAFSVCLAVFALLHGSVLPFPVGFFLGLSYFLLATALLTVLQEVLDDRDRAAVMALWFMAFGGTVPLGNLAFGPVMDHIGPRWVLLGGAAVAVVLAWWGALRPAAATSVAVE